MVLNYKAQGGTILRVFAISESGLVMGRGDTEENKYGASKTVMKMRTTE